VSTVTRDVTIWLLRHGESASNAGLPTNGHGDVPLTAAGEAQAAAAAERLPAAPDLLIDSPFLRARASADAIARRWPAVRRETWPIQEVTYLSPARCVGTTRHTRQPIVDAFWHRCDPDYVDGPDAESFAAFMARVAAFHRRLQAIDAAFVVAVGHGQFFAAYRHALVYGFAVTPAWMRDYRDAETASPLVNGEFVRLHRGPRGDIAADARALTPDQST
jgi:broad specificity phosphatase PhoE